MAKKPVTISLCLRLDSTPVGQVVFRTLLVHSEADYTCEPSDIVSVEQVQSLAAELRHLPARQSGRLGRYRWEEI